MAVNTCRRAELRRFYFSGTQALQPGGGSVLTSREIMLTNKDSKVFYYQNFTVTQHTSSKQAFTHISASRLPLCSSGRHYIHIRYSSHIKTSIYFDFTHRAGHTPISTYTVLGCYSVYSSGRHCTFKLTT